MITNFFVQEARLLTIFISFFQQDPIIIVIQLSILLTIVGCVWKFVASLIYVIKYARDNPKQTIKNTIDFAKGAIMIFVVGYGLWLIGINNIAIIIFVAGLLIFKLIAAIFFIFSAPATVGSNLMTGMIISDAIRDQNRRY